MSWDSESLNRRRPVWERAADFWVGKWNDPIWIDRTAKTFSASGYNKRELWRICIIEVAPVVAFRLESVSDGLHWWSSEFLEPRIKASCPSPHFIENPSLGRIVLGEILGLFARRKFAQVMQCIAHNTHAG